MAARYPDGRGLACLMQYSWWLILITCCSWLSAATHLVEPERLLDRVWESELTDFSVESYRRSLQALFSSWEEAGGEPIRPGQRGKVGLKTFTSAGPGLATPQNLLLALVAELESRGFQRSDILIVDLHYLQMRRAGLVQSAWKNEPYPLTGIDVRALDRKEDWDPHWFYENALPSREALATTYSRSSGVIEREHDEGRKSFLPSPLLFAVDFWINLPVALDHPSFGVSGALANGTVWSVSNQTRFMVSPANAPAAIAEIAAIPEYRQTWLLNLVSLERYQFIGGPRFNAYYTRSEPLLWLSGNPVALDFALYDRINYARREEKMPVIDPQPLLFEYAQVIGLGSYGADSIRLIQVKDQP